MGSSVVVLPRWLWVLALVLIGLFAFGFRWYYVAHAVVYHPIRGDAVQYHAYAWNLVHHGTFSQAPPHSLTVASDSFRDPGYPAFLALWMKAFNGFSAWYPWVLMTQAMLGALTVILLMASGRRWLPDRWLIAAGLLMAVWPHSVVITSFLLSETMFGFLCALGFFLLGRALYKSSTGWSTAAGLSFGAAALTNAVLIPFAPLLALALYFRRVVTRRLLLALAISAIALPLAWSIRNTQLPPSGTSSSDRAMLNLVQGSWSNYHSAYHQAVMGDPAAKHALLVIQHEYDVLHTTPSKGVTAIVHRIGARPLHYVGWYLSKPAELWGWSIQMGQGDIYVYPTMRSPFSDQLSLRMLVSVCQAANPLLMLMALAGCMLALPWRGTHPVPIASATALLTLYVTLVYSLLQSEPRYSIPFRGFEILLAIFATRQLAAWLQMKRQSMTAGSPNPKKM